MHLSSEVSSTTNQTTADGTASNNNTNSLGPLTAETLAERTLEQLLAEHPGELVRTGSPHIVSTVNY